MKRKLTIRQKVDGHEVRIEELEKTLRARSNHIDRLEQRILQEKLKPVPPGYYWATEKRFPFDSRDTKPVRIVIYVTAHNMCYQMGRGSRCIDAFDIIAPVGPPP